MYNEPDEREWRQCCLDITEQLRGELHVDTVCDMFKRIRDSRLASEEFLNRQTGAGCKKKLQSDNPDLKTAAYALNTGNSTEIATQLCNTTNEKVMGDDFNAKTHSVTWQTLMRTIRQYSTCHLQPVLWRKTRKKDETSPWAKARVACSKMVKEMIWLEDEVDASKKSLKDCLDKEEVLPLFKDGILFADQMHHMAVLAGGMGQAGSGAGKQWRVSVNSISARVFHIEGSLLFFYRSSGTVSTCDTIKWID